MAPVSAQASPWPRPVTRGQASEPRNHTDGPALAPKRAILGCDSRLDVVRRPGGMEPWTRGTGPGPDDLDPNEARIPASVRLLLFLLLRLILLLLQREDVGFAVGLLNRLGAVLAGV